MIPEDADSYINNIIIKDNCTIKLKGNIYLQELRIKEIKDIYRLANIVYSNSKILNRYNVANSNEIHLLLILYQTYEDKIVHIDNILIEDRSTTKTKINTCLLTNIV